MSCWDIAAQTDNTVTNIILAVSVALVDVDGRILLQERPKHKKMAGFWEFPGGKIEQGETPEQALIRELDEELGIETRQSCLAPIGFASHGYDDFHLLMPLYICRMWQGMASPREQQTLAWVTMQEIAHYKLLEADYPLIALLREWI